MSLRPQWGVWTRTAGVKGGVREVASKRGNGAAGYNRGNAVYLYWCWLLQGEGIIRKGREGGMVEGREVFGQLAKKNSNLPPALLIAQQHVVCTVSSSPGDSKHCTSHHPNKWQNIIL